MSKKVIIKVDYNGVSVAFEGKEMVNLTDLWRAAGSPELKDPNRWFTEARTADFLLALLEQESNSTAQAYLKSRPSGREHKSDLERWCRDVFNSTAQVGLVKTKRGKYGGTWANQIIAVSYAGYLSPKLQIFVNRVFLDRLQEERNPDLIAQRFIDTYKRKGFSDNRIALRFKSIQSNKQHNEVLKRHGVEGVGFAMCAHNINVGVLGTTKKRYLTARGVEPTENVRDHMSDAELAAETLAELLSDSKIEKGEVTGNKPCAKVCYNVAKEISDTMNRIIS